MAADELWIPFRGMNVHIKVIEPEGALLRRVFVLSSPVISTFNWRKILPEMNQAGALTVVMGLTGAAFGVWAMCRMRNPTLLLAALYLVGFSIWKKVRGREFCS